MRQVLGLLSSLTQAPSTVKERQAKKQSFRLQRGSPEANLVCKKYALALRALSFDVFLNLHAGPWKWCYPLHVSVGETEAHRSKVKFLNFELGKPSSRKGLVSKDRVEK